MKKALKTRHWFLNTMVKRIASSRRKTRQKLQKKNGTHGHVKLTAFLQKFTDGDTVAIVPDSSVRASAVHGRHISRIGIINGSQGKSYKVKINDKGKDKTILVHPVHLKHV